MPSPLTLTTPGFAAGKFGNALTAGYGIAAGLPSAAAYTIEAWIKSTATVATDVAFSQTGVFWAGLVNGKPSFTVEGASAPTNDHLQNTGPTAINDGAWHHVAIVLGATCRMYVDGTLAATDAGTNPSLTGKQANFASNGLGARCYSGSPGTFTFSGGVDELAVWTGEKYSANFTPPASPYAGTETNLARLYHLEADGTDSQGTAPPPPPTGVTVARNDPAVFYAPGVWQDNGTSRIANTTGAYLDLQFTGTAITLTTAALAAGQSAYPKLRAFVDNGPGIDIQLTAGGTSYPIASGLAAGTHALRLVTVAFDQGTSYWDLTASVRVNGFVIDAAATASAAPRRSKIGYFFGDSIVQGASMFGATDGVATQDGTLTFAHLLAEAFDIDMGQVGYGGQGFVNGGGGGVPAFNTAYSSYSAGVSRLAGGVLSPAPDYVFCEHGANPVGGTDPTQAQVAQAITNLRTIAPNALIFMFVPVGGFRRAIITAAVNAAVSAGDTKLRLIDAGTTAQVGFTGFGNPNRRSFDGIHPNQLGHATLAPAYAKLLQHELEPRRFTVAVS